MKFFRFFSKRSGNVAKERLQNVLISDRAGCSTKTLESIQAEMKQVLSKYFEIDTEHTAFKIIQKPTKESQGSQPVLIACIPFVNRK